MKDFFKNFKIIAMIGATLIVGVVLSSVLIFFPVIVCSQVNNLCNAELIKFIQPIWGFFGVVAILTLWLTLATKSND